MVNEVGVVLRRSDDSSIHADEATGGDLDHGNPSEANRSIFGWLAGHDTRDENWWRMEIEFGEILQTLERDIEK
ncbi:hypothetical protein [Haladaptatus sp. NG-WS-4]